MFNWTNMYLQRLCMKGTFELLRQRTSAEFAHSYLCSEQIDTACWLCFGGRQILCLTLGFLMTFLLLHKCQMLRTNHTIYLDKLSPLLFTVYHLHSLLWLSQQTGLRTQLCSPAVQAGLGPESRTFTVCWKYFIFWEVYIENHLYTITTNSYDVLESCSVLCKNKILNGSFCHTFIKQPGQ